jgi:hypothetical protein
MPAVPFQRNSAAHECMLLNLAQVQSLLFLKRNALARSIFSRKRILITLIGAIAIAIFDGLT